MLNEPAVWISNLVVGAAVAVFTYAGQDYFARGLNMVEQDLSEKLRLLRAPSDRLKRYLVVWAVAMGCALVGLGFVLGNPWLAILATVFLACAPWYIIRRMAERRREQIEHQLADAMVSFSSAIKAGLSLTQAIDILAAQSPKPVSEEFRQIIGEYHMGKPLERTLTEAKQRLKSDNFSLFCAAVLASRKSGGKLNETVDRIAHSVLELHRLERKVHVETAQARKSAVYMTIAPLVILVVYYFVDPVSTARLFTNFAGQILLGFAVAFNIIAFVWARAILRADI